MTTARMSKPAEPSIANFSALNAFITARVNPALEKADAQRNRESSMCRTFSFELLLGLDLRILGLGPRPKDLKKLRDKAPYYEGKIPGDVFAQYKNLLALFGRKSPAAAEQLRKEVLKNVKNS